MILKYASIDRQEFNEALLGTMSVFYTDLGRTADEHLRCRYEYPLCMAVEEHGQNILDVGGDRGAVAMDCGAENTEGLHDGLLHV